MIEEAYRILKPGGAFAIMEMNPRSPFLQKMVDNVFAFTAVSEDLVVPQYTHEI